MEWIADFDLSKQTALLAVITKTTKFIQDMSWSYVTISLMCSPPPSSLCVLVTLVAGVLLSIAITVVVLLVAADGGRARVCVYT